MPVITPIDDTAAPQLPYLPGLVRAVLLDDSVFADLCGGRCGTKAPGDVTEPYAKVDVMPGRPIDASAGAWSPLIQVGGWCAPGGTVEPEVAAWDIAARAAGVLVRVLNRPIEVTGIAGAWSVVGMLDGPAPMVDTSRGESNPVYGARVTVEVALHITRTN